jgi:hypothetical protein
MKALTQKSQHLQDTGAFSASEKKCSNNACGKVLPLADFHRNPSKRDGRDSRCKTCVSKQKKLAAKKRKQSLTQDVAFTGDPDFTQFAESLKVLMEG